jgi:hypothetical protein
VTGRPPGRTLDPQRLEDLERPGRPVHLEQRIAQQLMRQHDRTGRDWDYRPGRSSSTSRRGALHRHRERHRDTMFCGIPGFGVQDQAIQRCAAAC